MCDYYERPKCGSGRGIIVCNPYLLVVSPIHSFAHSMVLVSASLGKANIPAQTEFLCLYALCT
jgi:hypothetical protein